MILWLLSQLQSIVVALHSKDSPRQLAAGFALGGFIGWVPFNFLYSTLMLIVLYLVNVNMGFGLLGVLITTLLSFLLDPLSGMIGHFLLTQVSELFPLWAWLYNIPIVPFTRFNNTVMLGSIVLALFLAFPVYFLMLRMVNQYRTRWQAKIEKWRGVRWVMGTKWMMWVIHVKSKGL